MFSYVILKKQGYRVLIVEHNLFLYKVDEEKQTVMIHAVVDGRQEYRNHVSAKIVARFKSFSSRLLDNRQVIDCDRGIAFLRENWNVSRFVMAVASVSMERGC